MPRAIERGDEHIALDAAEGDVEIVGEAVLLAAVDEDIGDAREDAVTQPLAQGTDAAGALAMPLGREIQGDGGADDAGDVFGAGALLHLLAAAVQERLKGRGAAQEEDAAALGAAELVRGEAEGIDAERVDIEFEPARRLDGVGMEGIRGGRARGRSRGGAAAISAMGWTVPTSLFASMTLASTVSGRRAAWNSSRRDAAVRGRSRGR